MVSAKAKIELKVYQVLGMRLGACLKNSEMEIVIMTEKLLTSSDVQALTGIKSRVTLWRKSRNTDDRFPLPYKDGSGFTRWKLSEIQKWMDDLELIDI